MDSFLIFILLNVILTPFIALWAKKLNRSPYEYAFLSLMFTPVLPMIILLYAQFRQESGSKGEGELAN